MTTRQYLRRISVLSALFVATVLSAVADNKVFVEDFGILPDNIGKIDILMNNESENITALEFDIVFPKGLAPHSWSDPEKNTSRLITNQHMLNVDSGPDSEGNTRCHVSIFSQSRKAIKGLEGALFTLQIQAAHTFVGGELQIQNVIASASAKKVDMTGGTATVTTTPSVDASISLSPEEITMLTDGTTKATVSFSMNNRGAVAGMQGTILLPEGVKIVELDDEPNFTFGSRVPQGLFLTSSKPNDHTVVFVITSSFLAVDMAELYSGSGEVFSFEIVAEKGLPETGELKFTEVKVTNTVGKTTDVEDASLKIINGTMIAEAAEAARIAANQKAYEADLAAIAELQKALDEANATIAANYAEYADTEAAAAVQETINALKAAAEAALAAVEKEGVYTNPMDTEAVAASIAALVENAQKAQEAARVAANQKAYEADLAAIAELQKALDEANATIAANYAEYADAEAAAAVQEAINALKAAAEAALAAVEKEGVYTNTMDTEAVTASIAALVEKARKAYEAAQEAAEAARVAANQKAYEADLAAIAELQKALDEANATIAANYAEYADTEAAAAVQETINALKAAAEAALAAVEKEGVYTNPMDTEAVAASIAALVENAQKAQEAARVAANQKAYQDDMEVIAEFEDEFGYTRLLVDMRYPGYADAEATAAAKQAIKDAKAAVEAALKAVEKAGTYESPLTDELLQELKNKLQAMIDNALQASGITAPAFEEDQEVEIYTLDGKKVNKPVKGQINVFKYSNRTVKRFVR